MKHNKINNGNWTFYFAIYILYLLKRIVDIF